jgi:hypothetical protein
MSRQFRHRVTAIVLGGFFLGAPLLTNGTARAGQVAKATEGGHQVTFDGGGMLGLACHSRPDVESMVVPADSTVRVVNRTGHSAKLRLSGSPKGTLADDAATEVVFRRGTTEVLLTPDCTLGGDASPVMVTATPSASAAMPDPIPVPSDDDSAAPSVQADPVQPLSAPAGAALPDSVAPASRPTRPTQAITHPGTRRPATLRTSVVAQAARTAAQAMPQGATTTANRPKIKVKTAVPGTPGAVAPAFAGMPPGDRKALLTGVPKRDPAPPTVSSAVSPAPASTAAAPVTEIAAAEPVAAMTPMPEGQPIGLLALIAAVCAVGVTTATIRAFVSQRANRAGIA